ncbi:TetR/AcrR family transcriptional regulator [Halobacillus fulvus]|nr:TetR/AcrR family transcriptional regulator [Halobacillus fulvus]
MNGFERRKERKQANILNAALELFSEYGVQKVTIQEIAQKAQVSQVTIYNYFGGKDQLIFEAVKKFIYERLEKVQDLVQDPTMNFKEKIGLLITNKTEDLLHIHMDFLQTVIADQPDIQELVSSFTQKDSIPLLMELIRQGKDEGYVHPDFSFQTIMFYVEMYYQAFRSTSNLSGLTPQQLSEELSHMFFYGLAGNKEDSLPNKK